MPQYQADSVWVPVLPSFRDFGGAMTKGTAKPSAAAGKASGAAFAASFAQGSKSAGDLTELRRKLGESVRRVGTEVKKARQVEEDATRRVAIQEAKLQELRDSGKAKAAQILSAEDRLIKAKRAQGRAQETLTTSTKKLSDAQASAKREVREAEQAATKAGKSYGAFGGRIRSALKAPFKGFGATAGRAGQDSGRRFATSFQSRASKISLNLKSLAGAAVVAKAGYELGQGLAVSISKAGKFQTSMREVGIQTGQTGKGLRDLTDVAIEMGEETSFSAQGASEAMLALAKGGMSAADQKAGALKQTLTLATAGGLELGSAADFMVQGLSAFGLKAGDAGRVAVALAGGANASTASVESMGQALSQVGAGARIAGLSIEDTTAALAAFDNAGIKGSDAGTALKTFLTRLVPSTDKAASAMQDLGLITLNTQRAQDFLRSKGIEPLSSDSDDLTRQLQRYAMELAGTSTFTGKAVKVFKELDAENSLMSNGFFDSAGNIKSMSDVAGLLSKSLKGQTKEQKIATLATLFGSDAARAAAVLAEEGASGLAKFMKATRDKSAADKLAKSATEGYSGALERFQGSVETAQIKFGTKLLPVLTTGLNLLSGRFLPAIDLLGSKAGPILGAFATVGSGALKEFFGSLAGGEVTVKSFATYLSENQAVIIGTFVDAARSGIQFGKSMAAGTSAGLRAFAFLVDGVATGTEVVLTAIGGITAGAAVAFGWIPGIGPKLQDANKSFNVFADSALKGTRKAADGARGLADGIDNKIVPALNAAERGIERFGKQELGKAAQRDQAAKTARVIGEIGTKADGSQLKLKRFGDRTRLSAAEQAALKKRLGDASRGLSQQQTAMAQAGAGQDKLTRAWEKGRDRLYKEFRQMGLAKDEAKRLARQYAGVPGKVKTDISQPGMKGARSDTKRYNEGLADIPREKKTTISATLKVSLAEAAKGINRDLVKKYGKGARLIGLARGGFAGQKAGGVLPGNTPLSRGDDIPFPMTNGDIQPLRGGEGIAVTEAMRDPYERARLLAVNKAALRGENLAQFRVRDGRARGGTLAKINTDPFAGLRSLYYSGGTNAVAHIAAQRERELRSAAKHLIKINEEMFGDGPTAGGGYAKALKFARAQEGKPYVFGSAGPGGYDCSGFMAAIQNVIQGKYPYRRRYSTPAFHGDKAQGFTRGKKSAFMVGVNPAPGRSGHMAGTLNGVNVESRGGAGVVVGGGARGYSSGMFSWRGGLARGGMVGDLPYDFINPRGKEYDPQLAELAKRGQHVGIFDKGGYLQPGLTMAFNGTGKPERIQTYDQVKQEQAAARSGDRHYHAYGPDAKKVVKELHTQEHVDEVMTQRIWP